MSARHKAGRQPPPRGGRRVAERPAPRYGRIAALASSVVVTFVAVAAGMGMISVDGDPAYASVSSGSKTQVTLSSVTGEGAGAVASVSGDLGSSMLPATSGTGKRVVFDQSEQRVWLVEASGEVARTYLVSGSVTGNLDPGTYAVYSRSRWAVGVDESGVMEYFVRFAKGDSAAIGFHTIPTKNGTALQTQAQLGTPQSHGCIRQATSDAIALWEFAPDGTAVVVTT